MKAEVPCDNCVVFPICKSSLILFGGKRRIIELKDSCSIIKPLQPIIILSYFESLFLKKRKANARAA